MLAALADGDEDMEGHVDAAVGSDGEEGEEDDEEDDYDDEDDVPLSLQAR